MRAFLLTAMLMIKERILCGFFWMCKHLFSTPYFVTVHPGSQDTLGHHVVLSFVRRCVNARFVSIATNTDEVAEGTPPRLCIDGTDYDFCRSNSVCRCLSRLAKTYPDEMVECLIADLDLDMISLLQECTPQASLQILETRLEQGDSSLVLQDILRGFLEWTRAHKEIPDDFEETFPRVFEWYTVFDEEREEYLYDTCKKEDQENDQDDPSTEEAREDSKKDN